MGFGRPWDQHRAESPKSDGIDKRQETMDRSHRLEQRYEYADILCIVHALSGLQSRERPIPGIWSERVDGADGGSGSWDVERFIVMVRKYDLDFSRERTPSGSICGFR